MVSMRIAKKSERRWILPIGLLMTLMTGCSFSLLDLNGSPLSEHNIGINFFASQLDWVSDRLFADVMKTSREWRTPGNYGAGDLVSVDENGWPTTDAEAIIWHGIDAMNGTYYLEGECATSPVISMGFGKATLENYKYADGKFSANLIYSSTDRVGLLLTFRNTEGGIRNVKLMRPKTVGSSFPYSTTTLFTTQAKKLVENFKVIRFMWAIDAWNGPWQVSWVDRVQPDYCSYSRNSNTENIGWAGTGMPWEVAIQFCNETGKDMWLNMPLGADDDYIRQLATLVRDRYTVSNGKVYWEYSNEATWDSSGVCSSYLQSKGLEEAASGDVLDYDGVSTDQNILSARYYAKRAAEMSVIWRDVWGDSDMMTRIRPVASGQLTYDSELIWGLEFIHNWFNNGDGDHVSDPHPVSYYFYGCGGSHYTGDSPDALTSGVTEIEMFEKYEEEEACLAKIFGLKRCAYEGGVWTNANDYLSPRITEAMIRYHALWDKYDGDLFVYYVTTGGEEDGTALGFTLSAFDLKTRKFDALARILGKQKEDPSAGPMVPCSIPGADFSVSSVPWEHPAPAEQVTRGSVELNEWSTFRGYLFRVAKRARYTITLSFKDTTDALMEIMVDGELVAKETLSGSHASFSVLLDPGLHGVRIKKVNPGYFFFNGILIE